MKTPLGYGCDETPEKDLKVVSFTVGYVKSLVNLFLHHIWCDRNLQRGRTSDIGCIDRPLFPLTSITHTSLQPWRWGDQCTRWPMITISEPVQRQQPLRWSKYGLNRCHRLQEKWKSSISFSRNCSRSATRQTSTTSSQKTATHVLIVVWNDLTEWLFSPKTMVVGTVSTASVRDDAPSWHALNCHQEERWATHDPDTVQLVAVTVHSALVPDDEALVVWAGGQEQKGERLNSEEM